MSILFFLKDSIIHEIIGLLYTKLKGFGTSDFILVPLPAARINTSDLF